MDNENKGQERTPFGQRLLTARQRKGLTQKQVETRIGISQSNLGALELRGTGSAYTVALALLYDVNPVWLAMGIPPMTGERSAPKWLTDLTEDEMTAVEHYVEGLIAGRKLHRSLGPTESTEQAALPPPNAKRSDEEAD